MDFAELVSKLAADVGTRIEGCNEGLRRDLTLWMAQQERLVASLASLQPQHVSRRSSRRISSASRSPMTEPSLGHCFDSPNTRPVQPPEPLELNIGDNFDLSFDASGDMAAASSRLQDASRGFEMRPEFAEVGGDNAAYGSGEAYFSGEVGGGDAVAYGSSADYGSSEVEPPGCRPSLATDAAEGGVASPQTGDSLKSLASSLMSGEDRPERKRSKRSNKTVGSKRHVQIEDNFENLDNQSRRNARALLYRRPSLRVLKRSGTPTGSDFRANARWLVRHPWFEGAAAAMILSNAIFLGYQVDYKAHNPGAAEPVVSIVLTYVYMLVFTAELVLRLAAEQSDFLKSADASWNIFDAIVVVSSMVQLLVSNVLSVQAAEIIDGLNITRVVRIFRIIRVARIIKVMKFFFSLRVLVLAVIHALKSCVWALSMLMLIIYMFGILLTQATAELLENHQGDWSADVRDLQGHFGTLPRALFTLFLAISGGVSWGEPAKALHIVGSVYVGVFIGFIGIVYFGVLNVITGLFCQTAIDSASQDKDAVISAKAMQRETYKKNLKKLFQELDDFGQETPDGIFSLDELERYMEDARMKDHFAALDLELSDAWTFFKLLDYDEQGLMDIDRFIDGCLKLKGEAKSLDINTMLYEHKWLLRKVGNLISLVESGFDKMAMGMQHTQSGVSSVTERSPHIAEGSFELGPGSGYLGRLPSPEAVNGVRPGRPSVVRFGENPISEGSDGYG